MITQRIKKLFSNLTEAERKAATYVVEYPQEVTCLTVHQLARKCNVASSAVVRFCKSVGLQGFSQLKLELATEIGSKREEQKRTTPAVGHASGTEAVVRKVFHAGISTLQDTLKQLDYSQMEKMAQVLQTQNVRAKNRIKSKSWNYPCFRA